MLNTNQRGKSLGGHTIRGVFLSLNLMMSAAVVANGTTVTVPPPNGSDDTSNVQAALTACVVHGAGCTVQLQTGTYLSRQLVTYNFRGALKGMGKQSTIIEALPNLPVTEDDTHPCQPNASTCLWPSFIIFVDGDIRILDLSVHMPATEGTATVSGFLDAGIRVMGQHPTNLYIDDVDVEGRPDDTTFFGYNVLNGIMYTGELNSSSVDPTTLPCGAAGGFYWLSGSYTVRNSSVKTIFSAITQDGCVRSSHITIGGSAFTGNHFDNVCTGTDMATLEGSSVEISYNESSASAQGEVFLGVCAAMWVIPWLGLDPSVFSPSEPSQYSIHDNKLFTTGQFTEGIFLLDQPPSLFIDAVVWNNTIKLQNTLSEGIGVVNTKGTIVLNNSIVGSDTLDAIGLYSSTLGTIINNGVSTVTIDGSVGNGAEIFLDPGTSQDFVLCATPSDTVRNQGTGNIVVRCTPR